MTDKRCINCNLTPDKGPLVCYANHSKDWMRNVTAGIKTCDDYVPLPDYAKKYREA
jgi:hypothetical protein